MKLVDVKLSTYFDSSKEINNKDPVYKTGDIQLGYQNIKSIFAIGYVLNWSEQVFVIKKVRNTIPWTYVISDLKGEEIVGKFTKKNCKNQIKKSLELKK